MQIYGGAPRIIDRSGWGSGGSTYESANKVGSHPADSSLESRRIDKRPEVARDTAVSALRNDRFGTMLEQISDPRSSGSVALTGGNSAGNGTDFASAQSRYAENSE